MDLEGGHHLFVPVPWTPGDVKGLGMVDWASRVAAGRTLEELVAGDANMCGAVAAIQLSRAFSCMAALASPSVQGSWQEKRPWGHPYVLLGVLML